MTDSKKIDLILEKVTFLDKRMDRFEERMDRFEEKMDRFEERMDRFEEKMDGFEERMDHFETDLHEIKQHTKNTDLILENEIRVNIQRVAEGHLDLSRILHDAMHPSSEVEMLSLRVGMLESDVKRLKEKVS